MRKACELSPPAKLVPVSARSSGSADLQNPPGAFAGNDGHLGHRFAGSRLHPHMTPQTSGLSPINVPQRDLRSSTDTRGDCLNTGWHLCEAWLDLEHRDVLLDQCALGPEVARGIGIDVSPGMIELARARL